MREHDVDHDAGRARRCAKAIPLVAALGLALAGCDRCGDFFWQHQPGTCDAQPAPN